MAAKSKVVYVCRECGYETAKWMGKCPSCNSWSTLEEDVRVSSPNKTVASAVVSNAVAKPLSQIDITDEKRYVTGIVELDRVLGGGIVKGAGVLLSGDPGIGKSTILLQICNALQNTASILYVSGEESATQIKMRAERIGVTSDNITVMTETDAQVVSNYIISQKPQLVMIDSIQTMQIAELSSSTGSIVQVRECTNLLLRTCKSLDIPLFIVGHVNKGGDIAGPKVMEHIVDTVLYFEGERN
ncbi:MAG: DNA repair protein RadA, partial [Ruminococcaceae bacterium]|nr:DNA repair protein RadA [Oscillospiraceae bacterium]